MARSPRAPAAASGAGAVARSRDGRDWAWWPLTLLVVLPPLVVAPAFDESFRQPKLVASELLVLLGLLALAGRVRRLPRVELGPVLGHPALLATLPLLLAATVTLWTSPHPAHVRDSLPSLWIGALALAGWSLGLGSDERRRLLRMTIPLGVVLAAFALVQFYGANPFVFRDRLSQRMSTTSLAGNAFDLAAYLVVPALAAQRELAEATTRRARALYGGALAIALWASVVAQTLAVLLALPLASLVLWARRLGWRRTAAWLVLGSVLLGLTAIGLPPLRSRIADKVVDLQGGAVNRLLTGRLDGWRAAWWMFEQRPWTGVGHGAFRAEFGLAKLALLERGAHFEPTLRETYFANAHNDLLEALAEWGVFGGLAAAWGFGLVAWCCARRRGAEGDLARGGVIALAVLAIFDFPFHLALVAYPFLLLLSGGLAAEPPAMKLQTASSAPS